MMAFRLLLRGSTRAAYVTTWEGGGSYWCRSSARVQPFTIWSASSCPVRPPTRPTALATWSPLGCHAGWHQGAPLASFSSEAEGKERGEGSEVKGEGPEDTRKALVRKGHVEKVKIVIKEYGTVAVVFHTAISLFSLGTCYMLVSK